MRTHTSVARRDQVPSASPSITISAIASSAEKFSGETPAQQARHREIAIEQRRRQRKPSSPKKNVRICDLERIYADRYGPVLPDDDAGRDDLFVMANHLAHLDAPDRRISAFVRRCAPWHGDDNTAELIEAVIAKPLKWRADKLAQRLGLDYATRTRLGITTIGAIDCKKAKRGRLRGKRAATREMERRAKAGAKPHALSAEQTKPWIDEGVSRATHFRRMKAARDETVETDSCAAYPSDIVVDTKQSHGAPPPQGGSWARAVPTVSDVDTVVVTEKVYPDRIFMLLRETEIPVNASCLSIGRNVAKIGNGKTPHRQDGHAARRPKNPPRKSHVAAIMANAIESAEADHFEKYFQTLLWNYPRRDAADEARSTLRDMLAKSDSPGQVRCNLLDGADIYEAGMRAKGRTTFLRLDDFIRSEIWQPEMFDLAEAA
jgi:hypothetical protein